MLANFKKKVAVMVYAGTLLFSTAPVPAQAQPTQQTQSTQGGTATYQQAEKDLPQNMYVLYRVVDRLARANELDQRPWRVAIAPEYDINAFATEANLIAVYTGILDQLAGDSSALACIVGHEMGHHAKRHLVIGPEQQAAIIEKARQEAEKEVNRERKDATTEATAAHVGGGLLGGIVGGKVGSIGSSILGGAGNQRIASANERIEQIVAKKKEELAQRIAEANRTQEYESDNAGYLYATRAGFEPEGCLRAMNVLGQLPGSERDTDHPAVPKRIEVLKKLMTKYPPQSLAAEGKARIAATQPLTYDPSEDKVSLRVNSRNGGSSKGDLNRLFGE